VHIIVFIQIDPNLGDTESTDVGIWYMTVKIWHIKVTNVLAFHKSQAQFNYN
jgi:hypothetical protein